MSAEPMILRICCDAPSILAAVENRHVSPGSSAAEGDVALDDVPEADRQEYERLRKH